uniref:Uncharacterized protein n=1 Tax=Amphimedon queenslandica TaxID=400682 RepID=A0A1X7UVS4_AMPQE
PITAVFIGLSPPPVSYLRSKDPPLTSSRDRKSPR